jgi:predicted esterase
MLRTRFCDGGQFIVRRLLSLIIVWMLCRVGTPTFGADDRIQDVSFTAQCDGSEQKYVVLLPGKFQADEQHDILIALHGHGSDRWQFIKAERDECRAARDAAAKHDMIYVSPDYRAKTSWMGPNAEADVVQIIAGLKQTYRVRKVFLTGASMGGSACLTFAALHPDLVAGVASMNGTANHLEYRQFQDAIGESFGGPKGEKLDEYKRRSAEYWPEKFTMPVGITAGGKDQLVPPESVVRLGRVLQAMQRPVLINFRPDGGHETNYADATQILEFVIEQAGK